MKNNNKQLNGKVEESASVLRELKETIRKQSIEIQRLQQQQAKNNKTATTSHGQLHGAHGAGDEITADELSHYLHAPFYAIAFQRVGWLGLFLASLSITALIMGHFEHTLSKHIELAYFVPLLAGHGGNTGGQAVGTVLSALSAGIISIADAPKIVLKEAMSGFTMGICLGTIVGTLAHFVMGVSVPVATVIVATLPWVSAIAAMLGSAIPFACLALGLPPSVIAAPAMTSFVDVSGLVSYFWIANQVFRYFQLEL